MKLFGKELPNLPGRNPDLIPSLGKEYPVAISVTREQSATLTYDFRIDVESLVRDALINETYSSIGRYISKTCFKKKSSDIEASLLEDFLYNLKGYGFIIVNIKLGTLIQDMKDIELVQLKSLSQSLGTLYELGRINEYTIYVDPYLKWDEDLLAVVNNNFWNSEQWKDITIVAEGTKAPKTVSKISLNKKKPKSKVYKVNNIQI